MGNEHPLLCDFCTGNDPVVVFAVTEFSIILPSGDRFTGELGYWAACTWCQRDVETADNEAIIQRHLGVEQRRFGLNFPPEVFRSFHDNLFAVNAAIFAHRRVAIDINDPSITMFKTAPGAAMGEVHRGNETDILYPPRPVV
jgi:hypothetical protein